MWSSQEFLHESQDDTSAPYSHLLSEKEKDEWRVQSIKSVICWGVMRRRSGVWCLMMHHFVVCIRISLCTTVSSHSLLIFFFYFLLLFFHLLFLLLQVLVPASDQGTLGSNTLTNTLTFLPPAVCEASPDWRLEIEKKKSRNDMSHHHV